MTINKKFRVGILALTMLLIGVVFIASASTNSSQDTLSRGAIFEFNDSNSQRMQLPDFGPNVFDEIKKKPNLSATKGKIPQYATQAERDNWTGKLDDLRVNTEDDLSIYEYPRGPVIAHGWNINGYFEVTLYKGMNVTESQINEIYNTINKRANKASIKEIPVVFLKDDFVHDNTVSGYDNYYRPIIGAIQLTGETDGIGTLSFAAKTSDGKKGFVTVQHLGTYVGYTMYQPEKKVYSSYKLGTVSKISGTHADACFVPYSNVAAKIYINNGKTLPVATYMAAKPKDSWKGLKVYKSGRTTGVTSGTIKGIQDINNGLGKYYGLLDTDVPCSSGDSGAPLYTMPTSANSCNLLGIHKGGDSSHCYFSSVYGINYDLNVLPITT